MCGRGGGVNSAGTEKSLRGQRVRTGDGERERECNIYCLQSLVYYFTCISLGSLLPLFTLPPTPLVLPLCWYSSGSFVIYVALCRAWLARTFVNSKRPVSISWQASLYTVCPESATLPLCSTPLSTLDLAMRFLYVLMPSSSPKVPLFVLTSQFMCDARRVGRGETEAKFMRL